MENGFEEDAFLIINIAWNMSQPLCSRPINSFEQNAQISSCIRLLLLLARETVTL